MICKNNLKFMTNHSKAVLGAKSTAGERNIAKTFVGKSINLSLKLGKKYVFTLLELAEEEMEEGDDAKSRKRPAKKLKKDDLDSDEEEEDSDDDEDDSDESDEEGIPPPKKVKGKPQVNGKPGSAKKAEKGKPAVKTPTSKGDKKDTSKGVDATKATPGAASVGAGPPPPPPPPPPADLTTSGAAAADDSVGRKALFSELNKGADITCGLKKVTPDMQTHKNPALKVKHLGYRQGPTPYKAPVMSSVQPPSREKVPPPVAKKPVAKKPPKLELSGSKWEVGTRKFKYTTLEEIKSNITKSPAQPKTIGKFENWIRNNYKVEDKEKINELWYWHQKTNLK